MGNGVRGAVVVVAELVGAPIGQRGRGQLAGQPVGRSQGGVRGGVRVAVGLASVAGDVAVRVVGGDQTRRDAALQCAHGQLAAGIVEERPRGVAAARTGVGDGRDVMLLVVGVVVTLIELIGFIPNQAEDAEIGETAVGVVAAAFRHRHIALRCDV